MDRHATCFLDKDREHLLGIFEGAFGTMEVFNEAVRRLLIMRITRVHDRALGSMPEERSTMMRMVV